MNILPNLTRKPARTLTIGGTDYRMEGLSAEQFERFISEYVEHGIRPADFEAFTKRWLEHDAGEKLYKNGEQVYPREYDEV